MKNKILILIVFSFLLFFLFIIYRYSHYASIGIQNRTNNAIYVHDLIINKNVSYISKKIIEPYNKKTGIMSVHLADLYVRQDDVIFFRYSENIDDLIIDEFSCRVLNDPVNPCVMVALFVGKSDGDCYCDSVEID